MTTRGHTRRSQCGFTIIEIVVALGIFAVAVVALLGAQYSALTLTDNTIETSESARLLSEAAAIVENEVLRGTLRGEGEFDAAEGARYAFDAELYDPDFYPGLLRVQLEVTLRDNEQSLVFFVHDGRQKI